MTDDNGGAAARMAAGGPDEYPVTVHLGVLTASRPIGARIRLVVDPALGEREGTLVGLERSELSTIFYRLYLRLDPREDAVPLELPLSHPVTLLTGREGRPEDGHTFRITATIRGSSGVQETVDTEPHDYQDSTGFEGPDFHVEVRAWDLKTALERAAEYQLQDWRLSSGVRLGVARDEDFPA